jgi:hypothetical protein
MSTKAEDIAAPPDDFADVKPGLTEAEQAALVDDGESGDQVAGGDAPDPNAENSGLPNAEDQPKDADAASGDTTDDAAAAAAAADAAGSADDDDAASGTPPNAEPEVPRGVQLNAEIRPTRQFAADIDATIATVDEALTALETKLDAGDIQIAEFMRETRSLNTGRQELVADQREQLILQNANAALVETDWNGSVAQFMSANIEFQNPIMTGAFQAALQELYAVQENIGSSHAWYLETARRAVLEQITPAEATLDNPADNAGTPQQQAAAAIAAKGKTRSQAAATARKAVPTTLADTPAADANAGGEDEFSALDALNGIELEAALAKLTDAQQDKYLRAGM